MGAVIEGDFSLHFLVTLSVGAQDMYFTFVGWKGFHFGNLLPFSLPKLCYFFLKKKKKTPVIHVAFHIFSFIERFATLLYLSTFSIIYTVDSK